MSKRYNIVWIDDQFKEIEGFIDEAFQEGFDITAFASSREGMEYLEVNVSNVDALILDAKVFRDGPEDIASEKGLSASIREIARISGRNQGKAIPYVVYTGQPDLESDDDFADRMDGISIFSKNQETKPIFEELRSLIGASPDATVRNQYRATYEACHKGGIDPQCWKLLAPVLRSITHVENFPTEPYNDVRKALEWVFRYLHRHCVIHEKLIDKSGKVILQGVSHFLDGKPAVLNFTKETLQAKQPIFPKLLADCSKFILDVTQPGSHTEKVEDADPSKPSIAAVTEFSPNHHLIQTVAMMTADIAEWAVNYVAANPDSEKNRDLWIEFSTTTSMQNDELECEGLIISEDSFGNFFVGTNNLPETQGKNIRIKQSLIHSADRLHKGSKVFTVSIDATDKKYREAISYRLIS
ncbi:MAG: hypothetical protein ACK40T_09225 [Akkermansiaceae bacterium]|jgi:hypothetical protein